MSKTTAAVVCETNQISGHNQENVFFHGLYRVPEEFSSTYFRSAKSTTPIQIFACFSAQGDDTLAAMTLQDVLKKMQELTETTQQMSVLDYESFTEQVVKVLNHTVCQSSIDHNGAPVRVAMSMVIIEGDTLRVMNIGNTHIWLFRSGKLISLTENQTVAHRYVQMGAIDKSSENTHEGRNELTQFLGRFAQDGDVIPDKKVHLKLLNDDEICILGTGLDQGVSIQKMGTVIARPLQPETKAKEMIACAMQNGVKFGLTATVIHIDSTLILPGEANIEASSVTNDLAVAPKPVIPPTPAAPVSPAAAPVEPVSDATSTYTPLSSPESAPTIQSDELRYQMNQQLSDPIDMDQYNEEVLSEEEELLNTPENAKKVKNKEKKDKDKKGKKPSKLRYFLICFFIFLLCALIGYGGMYILFNAGHWTGKLKAPETEETDEMNDEEAGKVMYVLYDDTALFVEESLDSQAIDTLSRGEAVTLMAMNDTFAKVKKENGLMGYVPLEMIAEEDPTAGETMPEDFFDPTPVPTEPTAPQISDDTEPEETSEDTTESSETSDTEMTSEETSESSSEATSESTPESSDTTPSSDTAPSSDTTPSSDTAPSSEETPAVSSDTEATQPAPSETPADTQAPGNGENETGDDTNT